MCGRGVLWKVDAPDAEIALDEREAFLAVIRSHSGWPLDLEAARSVFTELLTNVFEHGKSPVSVWLDCSDDSVKLYIRESGRGFSARPALPEAWTEGGRGLFLASKFASDLDIKGRPRGTHVVATLMRKT
jgi:anti-sigma regulatory factor (Ser/Thr protein kinase)